MKKGIIIVNAYCKLPSMLNQANRLKEEFELLGVDITVIKNGYDCYIDSECNVISNLSGYDFCVYLDKDKYLGEMLEKSGLRLFNNISSIETCDDKMKTLLKLSGNSLSVPKTLSAPLCFTSGSLLSNESADEIIKILSLPLVVKKSFSSLGKGVYLVKSKNELIDLVNKNQFEPKIYQQFISSSYGKDVRIICIGKKYFSAMMRISKNDFRSNSALGGDTVKFDAPKEFIEVAEKVANLLNLDYMGIDLMFDENGKPVICEVNSNAFFTAMEQTCGVNVAKAYAMHVIKTVKEKLW